MFPTRTTWARAFMYGSLWRRQLTVTFFFFGGGGGERGRFKLVTNLMETKEAKCKYTLSD